MTVVKSPIEQAKADIKFFKFQKAVVLTQLALNELKLQKLEMFEQPNWELSEVVKIQEKIDDHASTLQRIFLLASQNGINLIEKQAH